MAKKQKLFELLPLETERLTIQRVRPERDASALIKMDLDPEVQAFLGDIKKYTLQERIRFLECEDHKTTVGSGGQLAVVRSEDSLTIGFVKLKIDEASSFATLSYIFEREVWGKGYCNESCAEIIRVGFTILGLSKICADTAPDNKRSTKVLMRLGMKSDGVDLGNTFREQAHFIKYCITKQAFEQNMLP